MFEKELNETKNPAVKRIGNYLMERAKTDPLVANNLKKEKKSLNECWDYVLSEVAKTMFRSGNFGCAAGDDEELLFEAVDEAGFRFGNEGNMFFVPCYSEQNGYYSTDLQIFYNGEEVLSLNCEEKFY